MTPITDAGKAGVRATVFHHLAGIAMAPTTKALSERGGFDLFIAADAPEWVDLEDIIVHTRGNRGYLRVALRLLASAGWLRQRVERNGRLVSYALTEEGRTAVPWAPPLYSQAVAFLPKTLFLEDALFGRQDDALLPSLQDLVAKASGRWDIAPQVDPVAAKIADQVRRHLDGVLVGPLMVILARAGVLARLEQGPVAVAELGGNAAMMACVFDLLATQGWAERTGEVVELTPQGAYAAQIAAAYGVTVSYSTRSMKSSSSCSTGRFTCSRVASAIWGAATRRSSRTYTRWCGIEPSAAPCSISTR